MQLHNAHMDRVELLRQVPGFDSSIPKAMQKRVNTPHPAKFRHYTIQCICRSKRVQHGSHTKKLQEQNPALLSLYLGIPDCRYAEDSPQ
jgi:hypothetical protein